MEKIAFEYLNNRNRLISKLWKFGKTWKRLVLRSTSL